MGAVVALDFSDGNGTTSVTQYTGIAGNGWKTAWQQSFGADTSSGQATVMDESSLIVGGGNYLHVTYDAGSGSNRSVRVSRQWDITSVSLTNPFTIDFDFRSDTTVSNNSQTFLIFGSSAAASTTGSSDSWKISADGGGWHVFDNNTTLASFSTPAVGTATWHVSITIDVVTDTWSVSLTNLSTSIAYTASDLALRNGADASLSWINFVSNGGQSQSDRGFSLDNIAIRSVIPEPSSIALTLGGILLCGVIIRRVRANA